MKKDINCGKCGKYITLKQAINSKHKCKSLHKFLYREYTWTAAFYFYIVGLLAYKSSWFILLLLVAPFIDSVVRRCLR